MNASTPIPDPATGRQLRAESVWTLSGAMIGAMIPIGLFAYDTCTMSAYLSTLSQNEQPQIVHCGMPVIGLFFSVPALATMGALTGLGLLQIQRRT